MTLLVYVKFVLRVLLFKAQFALEEESFQMSHIVTKKIKVVIVHYVNLISTWKMVFVLVMIASFIKTVQILRKLLKKLAISY